MDTTRSGRTSQSGFTLLELMMTLAIMAILLGVAAPGLWDTMKNVRMTGRVNDLMSDLALARSEAIKRGVSVRLCPNAAGSGGCANNANWGIGWFVFVDTNNNGNHNTGEDILRDRRQPAGVTATYTVTLAPVATNIQFRSTGLSAVGAVQYQFTFCDGRVGRKYGGRVVTIGPTGRAVVSKIPGC